MPNRPALWTAVVLGCAASNSFASGLGQKGAIEEIVVSGQHNQSLSAISALASLKQLQKVPGAIGFVTADDFLDNFTQSIGDTLVFTPGVFADTSAQRENRISIRGSGLNATFERRGLTVLRDGVPISRASGITEFQEIDPLSIEYIEVFKGANGLRYGAASLGGAINIVTPTGRTRDSGTHLRVEGGSFGTRRASINTSGRSDTLDYYGAVTKLDSNGFRNHSAVDSIYSFGNVGIRLSDDVETRFYLTALQDDFELAGALSRQDVLQNPTRAGSSNITFDQDRNLNVYRLANRTAIAFDNSKLELGLWAASRILDHAITPFVGIIDQREMEYGLSAQWQGETTIAERDTEWTLGLNYATSDNDARVFANDLGQPGNLTSDDHQSAKNTVLFAQADTALSEQWHLILGLQYVDAKRTNRHQFGIGRFGPLPDDSGSLSFNSTNARIGVLWAPQDNIQHYANISQGYEPPGITDITSGGALDFTPLLAQQSTTVEVGTRGHYKAIAWDAALYHSTIENEFIDVAAPGFGAGTVTNTDNALGDTIHQGLELGIDLNLLSNSNGPWQLRWRNILTYNRFQFDNDPVYGNNTLAGVPEAIYVSELRLDHNDNWYAGLNFRHIANGAQVDFANSAQAPGYQLLGLTAGWNITPSLRVFASAENLTDEAFISNVSTVANLATEGNQNVFTPGEGRSAYIGVALDF
ncbi:TonB-dependent receptor family protein [Porticoccus sp. GXU_MW_L64]